MNASLNIARRLGRRIRISRKIESYLVTCSGVRSLTPRQESNTLDSEVRNPAH
ncbi:MAG: hypothetical protein RQ885_04100 [Desulfurococcales archaeon]|nr:hypothetical protein [Desulfurococcales archaeon]